MDIVYLTAYPMNRDDGPVSHILGVVRGLVSLGHNLQLFAPGAPRLAEELFGVESFDLPHGGSAPASIVLNAAAGRQVVRTDADIIYLRAHAGLTAPLFAARPCAKPCILEINGMLLAERKLLGVNPVTRLFLWASEAMAVHLADHIVSVSDELAQELQQRYQVNENKISVVHNGVDTTRYTPENKARIRRELQLPLQDPVVGYVGALQPWRCLDVILEAIALLTPRMPNIKLIIVGGGPEESRLKQRARSLGTNAQVHFTGKVSQNAAVKWTQALDIGLSFDRLTHSSLKLRTYAACGIYQLGSAHTATGEYLIQQGLGETADDRSPAAIADALERLLGNRRRIRHRGAKARQVAERYFDWRRVAYDLEAVCLEVLQTANRGAG